MADIDTSQPGAPAALPEPPGAPWVTILSSLLIMFFFGSLVVFFFEYAKGLQANNPALTGEQQLQELRTQENGILDNNGYDPATKTWRIPIDRAMDVLIEEGKKSGDLKSFPAKASR